MTNLQTVSGLKLLNCAYFLPSAGIAVRGRKRSEDNIKNKLDVNNPADKIPTYRKCF
jgi:hypothetical protein